MAYARNFIDLELDAVLHALRLNAIAQTQSAHDFGAKMKKAGRGGMIFVGSNAACAGIAGLNTYCAAKAFTHTLCEGLWYEHALCGPNVMHQLSDLPVREVIETRHALLDEGAIAQQVRKCILGQGNRRGAQIRRRPACHHAWAMASHAMRGIGDGAGAGSSGIDHERWIIGQL
jgi:hypothetical protein